jgi:hypothetical protein
MNDQNPDATITESLHFFFARIVDFTSIVGALTSFLNIFGANQTDIIVFVICVTVLHAFAAIRKLFPNYKLEPSVLKRLVMISDVHYITILLVFSSFAVFPFSYFLLYTVFFTARLLTFVSDRADFLLNTAPIKETARNLLANQIFISIPSYVEIVLGIQLVWGAVRRPSLGTSVPMVVYVGWLMLFNFASSEIHARAWKAVAVFFLEIAAKNAETFGPRLEEIVNWIGEFGAAAAKVYPQKEMKVHLQ